MKLASSKVVRAVSVTLLLAGMIYFGFKRERYLLVFDNETVFRFLNKYPKTAVTDYKKEMGGLLGFNFSPKLISSVLFSFVYLVLTALIIHIIFKNKKYSRLTVYLFLAYMIVCFALIQLGALGVDYRLSIGLSHYLEDLFLSPFPLMFLIPAFIISDRMNLR